MFSKQRSSVLKGEKEKKGFSFLNPRKETRVLVVKRYLRYEAKVSLGLKIFKI